MSPRTTSKSVMQKAIGRLHTSERVVQCRRSEQARLVEKAIPRLDPRCCGAIGAIADQSYPTIALQGEYQPTQCQGRWIRWRQGHLPIRLRVGGNLYDGGGVSGMKAHLSRFRLIPAKFISEMPTSARHDPM